MCHPVRVSDRPQQLRGDVCVRDALPVRFDAVSHEHAVDVRADDLRIAALGTTPPAR